MHENVMKSVGIYLQCHRMQDEFVASESMGGATRCS